jgi:hypothetical protein
MIVLGTLFLSELAGILLLRLPQVPPFSIGNFGLGGNQPFFEGIKELFSHGNGAEKGFGKSHHPPTLAVSKRRLILLS